MRQVKTYDTIIGKIVQDYDADFNKIRVFQEDINPELYFMLKDVLSYLNPTANMEAIKARVSYVFKKFSDKEVVKKRAIRNINCNMLTKYGLIRCITLCNSNNRASIALREFIYKLFDSSELESHLPEFKANMESADIQAELKKVDEEKTGGIVYFIKDSNSGYIKIGRTNGDIEGRLSQLQVGNPNELSVVKTIECDSHVMEKQLHEQYAAHHIRGEWFDLKHVEF